jgi:outer membrane protein assembly factor BamA
VKTCISALFLLKLLIISANGYGQQLFVLEEVTRDGNILTRAVSPATADESIVVSALVSSFTDIGYLNFDIDSIVTYNQHLIVYYSTGNRQILRNIHFQSADTITKEYSGDFYSTRALESKILDKISSTQNDGYPFASTVISKLVYSESDSVDVFIAMNPGPQVMVSGISFTGNRQLSDKFLEKLSGFESPRLYTNEIGTGYQRNLNQSQFLSDVKTNQLIAVGDEYRFLFDVEEIRPSYLDLILGFDPGASGGDRFIGNGKLTLNNLLSEGSVALLQFNKLPGTETRLKFEYQQIWMNQWPIENTLRMDFHQRDSTYYQVAGSMEISYIFNQLSRPGIFLSYNVLEGNSANTRETVINSRTLTYGISYKYENLNRYYSPSDGSVFHVQLGNKFKGLNNRPEAALYNSSYNSQFIEFFFQHYFPFKHKIVLTPRLSGGYSNNPVYFEDDLFRLGGTNSIRGYREDQFRSSAYIWSDFEVRYLLDSPSYFFGFMAYGLEQRPTRFGDINSSKTTNMLYSAGIGLSYRIPLGFLKFSYAVSPEDRFNNGKIHFGITNSF